MYDAIDAILFFLGGFLLGAAWVSERAFQIFRRLERNLQIPPEFLL